METEIIDGKRVPLRTHTLRLNSRQISILGLVATGFIMQQMSVQLPKIPEKQNIQMIQDIKSFLKQGQEVMENYKGE